MLTAHVIPVATSRLACVASVFVGSGSKERLGYFARAKNRARAKREKRGGGARVGKETFSFVGFAPTKGSRNNISS